LILNGKAAPAQPGAADFSMTMKKRKRKATLLEGIIPASLVPVFKGQEAMTDASNQLRSIAGNVKSWTMESFASKLDMDGVLEHLAQAMILIGKAMPYCPCGCVSNRHECVVCGGKGWVSCTEYQMACDRKSESRSRESSRIGAA
jgi:hypothetical protein